MKREATKIVRKFLSFKQKKKKKLRMDIAQEMSTTFNGDLDLVNKIITGEASWVYGYPFILFCYDRGLKNPNSSC